MNTNNKLYLDNINEDIDIYILIDINYVGYRSYAKLFNQFIYNKNIIIKGFMNLNNSYKKKITECNKLNKSGVKLISLKLDDSSDTLLISYTNKIITTYYLNDEIDNLKLLLLTYHNLASNIVASTNSIYGFENIFYTPNHILINYHINNC